MLSTASNVKLSVYSYFLLPVFKASFKHFQDKLLKIFRHCLAMQYFWKQNVSFLASKVLFSTIETWKGPFQGSRVWLGRIHVISLLRQTELELRERTELWSEKPNPSWRNVAWKREFEKHLKNDCSFDGIQYTFNEKSNLYESVAVSLPWLFFAKFQTLISVW